MYCIVHYIRGFIRRVLSSYYVCAAIGNWLKLNQKKFRLDIKRNFWTGKLNDCGIRIAMYLEEKKEKPSGRWTDHKIFQLFGSTGKVAKFKNLLFTELITMRGKT